MRLFSPEKQGFHCVLNMYLDVNPMGKPRMTRRDKWKKRPSVLRWFAYKDEIKLKTPESFDLPMHGYWMIFTFKPSPSWATARAFDAYGKPHNQKPDKDNLEKGILDIYLPDDDSKVYDGRVSKQWGIRQNLEIWCPDGTG